MFDVEEQKKIQNPKCQKMPSFGAWEFDCFDLLPILFPQLRTSNIEHRTFLELTR